MDAMLRRARDWLNECPKTSFMEAVEEAKLTPRQRKIIEKKFLQGCTNYRIAMDMYLSTKTVDSEVHKIYRKISHIMCLQPG